MTSEKKYLVYRIVSEWCPDQLNWIIPVEKIEGIPELGGGTKELMDFIDSCVDGADMELSARDGDSLKITVVAMTLEELREVYVYS